MQNIKMGVYLIYEFLKEGRHGAMVIVKTLPRVFAASRILCSKIFQKGKLK